MNKKALLTTMYKNNSGLIAKTKVRKYKKGLCLTEKILRKNPLLFLYETVQYIQNPQISIFHRKYLHCFLSMPSAFNTQLCNLNTASAH